MSRANLTARTTREVPSALTRKTFIAPALLPVCCVCKLIRDETGSSFDPVNWITRRAYRKTHGANPADFTVTHTYCPKCFKRAMDTLRQPSRDGGS